MSKLGDGSNTLSAHSLYADQQLDVDEFIETMEDPAESRRRPSKQSRSVSHRLDLLLERRALLKELEDWGD